MSIECEPCSGESVGVTALTLNSSGQRLKRKRSPALRPVLRGSFRRNSASEKVIWSGCWGLTTNSFDDVFTDGTVKAPFYFERRRLADDCENNLLLSDGYFSGYFCMQDKSTAAQRKTSTSFTKHFESNILLRFSPTKTNNVVEVLGSGQNRFGKFLIEGKYNLETEELNCARNYIPRVLRRRSVRSQRRASEPCLSPRRSSRERTPSIKLKESYLKQNLRKAEENTIWDFPGRVLLHNKLNELKRLFKSDVSLFEKLQLLVNDLKTQQVKSFRGAKSRLRHMLRLCSNPVVAGQLMSQVNEIEVSCKPKEVPKKTLDKPSSGSYTSLFDCIEDVEEIDPMAINPAAKLPDFIRSPTLVDFKNCFKEVPLTKDLPDLGKGERSKENDADEEGLNALYPINNVDFSDLANLDSDIIKQLNEFVEFSCPSKGA